MKDKKYYIDKINELHPNIILKCSDPDSIVKKSLLYLDRVCDVHGLVSTPVRSLLEGRNCKFCSSTTSDTLELFIQKLSNKHKNILCLSQQYINNSTKMYFTCNKCNSYFYNTPNQILTGNGCLFCFKQNYKSPFRLTTDQFISKSKSIHIDKDGYPIYDYSNTEYIKANCKVSIICPIHGEFKQLARDHTNGKKGCPSCSTYISKAEKYLVNKLYSKYKDIKTSYRPSWLNRMEIDIFIPQLNLGIEYNGITYHHSTKGISEYCDNTYKHKEYHLDKYQICLENNMNLIHIFEGEDLDKWVNKILSFNVDTNKVSFSNIERKYGIYTYYGFSEID